MINKVESLAFSQLLRVHLVKHTICTRFRVIDLHIEIVCVEDLEQCIDCIINQILPTCHTFIALCDIGSHLSYWHVNLFFIQTLFLFPIWAPMYDFIFVLRGFSILCILEVLITRLKQRVKLMIGES